MSIITKSDKTLDLFVASDIMEDEEEYMKERYTLDGLAHSREYTRTELYSYFRNENENLSDSTFRWLLFNFLKSKLLFHVGFDRYSLDEPAILSDYQPVYSDKADRIIEFLKERYPDVEFVVFESFLMNEFLNQLIAKNTIFVQTEKDLSSFVFSTLHNEFRSESMMYNPTREEYRKYWVEDSIVISDLVTQSPKNSRNPYEICLEKMLVDMVSDKNISRIYSRCEISSVIDNAMKSYYLDKKKLMRYAGRRGCKEEFTELLKMEEQ